MEKAEYLKLLKHSKDFSNKLAEYFKDLRYHIPKTVCDIDRLLLKFNLIKSLIN